MIHIQKFVFLMLWKIETLKYLMSTNETKNMKWYETCKCECRLDAIVCNDKQRWNNDKCQFECKELIDKGVCDKVIVNVIK